MDVMGIRVDDDLLARWVGWFAPESQPFLVGGTPDPAIEERIDGRPLPDELLDTFELYGTSGRFRLAWFDEDQFMSLDRPVRARLVRAQVDHGRTSSKLRSAQASFSTNASSWRRLRHS